MITISFARHGQASFGKEDYDELSDLGREQSGILGRYLADTGQSFDRAYSGEMKRQKQTAHEVMSVYTERGLSFPELQIISDLNEFDFSKLMQILVPVILEEKPSLKKEMPNIFTDRKAFKKIIDLVISKWISGVYDLAELEWHVFTARIRTGIKKIIEENSDGKNIIIFSSGGPISAVVQMALGLSEEKTAFLAWQIYNASLNQFLYNRKGLALSSFNNVSHLELECREELITYR